MAFRRLDMARLRGNEYLQVMVERVFRRNNEIQEALSIKDGETEVSHHYNSKYVQILREHNNLKIPGKKT